MSETTYKLEELARAAETSPRTVRYYVQRGLLPAPRFRGKDTAYDHDHLVRLRAIRRLQEAFFPLDAIAAELARRSIDDIARLADGKDHPQASPVEATPAEPGPHREGARLRAPVGRSLGRSPSVEALRKIRLADGVDLLIADDAPPASRRLAEAILEIALAKKEG